MRRPMATNLLTVLLASSLSVSEAVGINCGCPHTCTSERLAETNGANHACGARIQWLMQHHDLPEANACAIASKHNPFSDEADTDILGDKSCSYEACHPEGCGSTLANITGLDTETVPPPPSEEKSESAVVGEKEQTENDPLFHRDSKDTTQIRGGVFNKPFPLSSSEEQNITTKSEGSIASSILIGAISFIIGAVAFISIYRFASHAHRSVTQSATINKCPQCTVTFRRTDSLPHLNLFD
mmetsp:Transcript_31977/g.42646  ORF Transcript_31977/g.42646 Transcript_31977/m.42646 type:complete len:241 (+) Transcript_31977:66-788(+)